MTDSPPDPTTGELARRVIRRLDELLADPSARVCVGLAGGPDSVALLHMLATARPRGTVEAAHLHHGIRGEEADGDEAFCRDLAGRLGVRLHLDEERAFRVTPDPGRRVSEAEARERRYAFFRRVAERGDGPRAFALAHHRDDQIETILLNLIRGTGIRGLRGMPARRALDDDGSATVVRPMLGESRASILAYLERHGLSSRTDSTNRLPDATRNRIRETLLPVARELDLDPTASLERLASIAAETTAWIDAETDAAFERVTRPATDASSDARAILALDLDALRGLAPALRRHVLVEAVVRIGGPALEYDESRRLLGIVDEASDRAVELRGAIRAERNGPALLLTREASSSPTGPAEPTREHPLPLPGEIELADASLSLRARVAERAPWPVVSREDPNHEIFDAEALSLPLTVRTWRAGDRVDLEGGGRQKLQDLWVDRKVPAAERNRVPLLVDADGRILWVVGIRRSPHARVTEGARRIVEITAVARTQA